MGGPQRIFNESFRPGKKEWQGTFHNDYSNKMQARKLSRELLRPYPSGNNFNIKSEAQYSRDHFHKNFENKQGNDNFNCGQYYGKSRNNNFYISTNHINFNNKNLKNARNRPNPNNYPRHSANNLHWDKYYYAKRKHSHSYDRASSNSNVNENSFETCYGKNKKSRLDTSDLDENKKFESRKQAKPFTKADNDTHSGKINASNSTAYQDVMIPDSTLELEKIFLLMKDLNSIPQISDIKKNNLSRAIFCLKKNNQNSSLVTARFFKANSDRKIDLGTLESSVLNIKDLFKAFQEWTEKLSTTTIIENFTVHTNLELDFEGFNKFKITIQENSPERFKFIVDKKNKLFESLLHSTESNLKINYIPKNIKIENFDDMATKIVKAAKESLQTAEQSILRKHPIEKKHEDFKKIAYYFFKKPLFPSENLIVFSDIFLDQEFTLPDSLDSVRKIIISKLEDENISFNQLKDCKFKSISNWKTMDEDFKRNTDDNEKRIKDFFNKLEFFVDKTTNENIRQLFPGIDLKHEFDKVERNLLSWIQNKTNNPFEEYQFTKLHLDVIFNEKTLKDFKTQLNLNQGKRMIILETHSPILTKRKLFQLLQIELQYTSRNLLHKFYHYEEFSKLNDIQNLLESTSINLIIIEWHNKNEPSSRDINIFQNWKKWANSSNNCFIMIGNSDFSNKLIENFQDECKKFTDVFQGLNDLTKDSSRKLFEKIDIFLHGQHLKLKNIVNFEDFKEIMKKVPSELFHLIEKKNSIDIDLFKFFKDIYIEIGLNQIIISAEVFKNKNNRDVFIIENIVAKNLRNFIDDDEYYYPVDKFKDKNVKHKFYYCTSYLEVSMKESIMRMCKCERNIHIFKYHEKSKQFIWKQTIGSTAILINYQMDINNHTLENTNKQEFTISADTILNKNPDERIVIISAESGAGKSTFIHLLNEKAHDCNKDSPHWFVNIKLSNTMFQNKENEVLIDFYAAISFLSSLLELHYKTPLYNQLRKCLFEMSTIGNTKIKLVLFFEGFENLDLQYANLFINLLKILRASSIKKFFITTTPQKKVKLERELSSFSYSLQSFDKEDKIRFLTKYLSKETNLSETSKVLNDYVNYFILSYSSQKPDLTTTPLLLKILADINKIYVESGQKITKSITNYYTLFKIHSEFFDDKKKQNLQKFSLKVLLNPTDYSTLIPKSVSLSDIKSEDYHNIILEYFAAQYIHNVNTSVEKKCEYIDKIIPNSSPIFFTFIVGFFHLNEKKIFDDFLNCATTSSFINLLDCLLNFKEINYNFLKGYFHHALYENNSELIKYLIKRYDLKNIKNEPKLINSIYKDKSVLHYALVENRQHVSCQLLLSGCRITDLDHTLLKKMATYVGLKKGQKIHRYDPSIKKLFEVLPEVIENLKDVKDKARIFKNFLSLINKSSLSDSDRLDLTKDFIKKFDSALLNEKENYMYSILQTAVQCGHLKTFEYFIDKYSFYDRFLKNCLRRNQFENINFIIDFTKKIDIKKVDTILHDALKLGVSPRTLGFLLKKFDIDAKNDHGETPLCVAVKNGADLNIIKILLEKQANYNAEDNTGLFVWCYVILEEITINKNGKLVCLFTCKYNRDDQLKIMQMFKETNRKFKIPESKKGNEQFNRWREELVMKLDYFENVNSFKINFKDDRDLRLHVAISSKNKIESKIWTRFLINFGADVNIEGIGNKKRPLHKAIEVKNYKVAIDLLRFGAIFNEKFEGKKPLNLLENNKNETNYYHKRLIYYLKVAQNIFNANNFSEALKNYLPRPKNTEDARTIRNILHCRDHRGYTLLHIAAELNKYSMLKDLLNLNRKIYNEYIHYPRFSLDTCDLEGNTPMHIAASKGHKEAIIFLMSKNASFDKTNFNGETPSDIAKKMKFINVVDLLTSATNLFRMIQKDNEEENIQALVERYPCLVNTKEYNSGRTPIHYAAIFENKKIMKLFISTQEATSSVDSQDSSMKTPLHYAVEKDNIEIVKLLLNMCAIDFRDDTGRRPFDLDDEKNKSAKMLRSIYKLFEDIHSDCPKLFVDDDHSKTLTDYLQKIVEDYEIEKSTVINVRDFERNQLLYYAATYDYKYTTENLLRHDASCNYRNFSTNKPNLKNNRYKKIMKFIEKNF